MPRVLFSSTDCGSVLALDVSTLLEGVLTGDKLGLDEIIKQVLTRFLFLRLRYLQLVRPGLVQCVCKVPSWSAHTASSPRCHSYPAREVISRQLEVISWQLEVISWQLEVISRQLEVISRQLEVISWQLEVISWQSEVISWPLEVISWQLEVISWQLEVISWQLGRKLADDLTDDKLIMKNTIEW